MSIDAAYFGEEVDAGALPEMQPSAVKTDQGWQKYTFIIILINSNNF